MLRIGQWYARGTLTGMAQAHYQNGMLTRRHRRIKHLATDELDVLALFDMGYFAVGDDDAFVVLGLKDQVAIGVAILRDDALAWGCDLAAGHGQAPLIESAMGLSVLGAANATGSMLLLVAIRRTWTSCPKIFGCYRCAHPPPLMYLPLKAIDRCDCRAGWGPAALRESFDSLGRGR